MELLFFVCFGILNLEQFRKGDAVETAVDNWTRSMGLALFHNPLHIAEHSMQTTY